MREKEIFTFYFLLLIGILLIAFVFAAPNLNSGISDFFNEDKSPVYTYNFTKNISGTYTAPLVFSIEAINSSEHGSLDLADFSWITINSTTGVMTFNSTRNNETGAFNISIHVVDAIPEGVTVSTSFKVNATNDNPLFTHIDAEYNLSQDENFLDYINASDEEAQYPLYFNISFFTNCTHASWSTRTNCSLFTLTNIINTSSKMNFTSHLNDIGTYWANISITDFGENYSCPHVYCENLTYMKNKTTSTIVVFNVFSALSINVTDCQNKIFQESQSGACEISITTRGGADAINVSSRGSLRNYVASVSNRTWFYSENITTADNFTKTIFVNVTPQKTEIGNWTINFTVKDTTSGEMSSELIYVFVNRTLNDAPDLVDISNRNTSVDLSTTINLIVYDDDLLVPDKSEGYNETIDFNVTILNQSNLNQQLTITGFDVEILNMPVSGTNRTEARIQFNVNETEAGSYTINITVNDLDNSIDSDLFNLTISSNNYPVWNQTIYNFNLVVNSSLATTTRFGPINLTGNGYITDTGDTITFVNDSDAMPRFNLSSSGMIVFTPYKQDVGSWNFTITATDSLGLQNTTTFRFNITNTNSEPVIKTPLQAINASVDANSNINASEDNYTVLTLFIQDEDFRVDSSKKDYYNESLTINLTIQGGNTHLFSFVKDSSFPTAGNNQSRYTATFTPNRTDAGNYNITINATDINRASNVLYFNLTVNGVNDGPVLTSLENKTSAVNRNFYYDINASDEEDGEDTAGSLYFTYSFLNGASFLNTTTFNSTSGKINITFNSNQAGKYRINITVNDTSNLLNSQTFWIYVYNVPSLIYPLSGQNFSLQENTTSNLTFIGNHSVQDNLTYSFYINNNLRHNLTYYGNETNLTWAFTPNFTDETNGENINLTLIVYPTNSNLENRIDLNYTHNWNVNISHLNSPPTFSGYIGDKQTNYDQTAQINLSQYFSDIDHDDYHYNQTINFTVTSNSSPSYITSSVSSSWVLTLSSLIAVNEIVTITANDSSTTASSNSFEMEFTTPSTTTVATPSSGGGGGGATIPVSLKIIIPEPVSAYQKDKIILPLTIYNNGQKTLSGISLSSIVVKNNLIMDDIVISFDRDYIDLLNVGQKEEVTMTIDVDTEENGTFELTINATVASPKYDDWGKIYLTVKESNSSLLEKLIFTQEFLEENPECIELEELLDEARAFFAKGDFVNTVMKIQESINGCKNAISQESRVKRKDVVENKLYRYLLIFSIAVFFLGILYYSYKRMRLRRGSGDYFIKQKESKNPFNRRAYLLVLIPGIFVLFLIPLKNTILGFAIRDAILGSGKISLLFVFTFILIFAGFLFLLFRRRKIKKIQEKKYVENKYWNYK